MNGDIRRYFTRVENIPLENTNVAESAGAVDLNTNMISDNLNISLEISNVVENDGVATSNTGINEGIEYEIIPGQRKGSKLVYLINEKYIFKPINGNDKYGKRYICSVPSCPARIIIRPNGICEPSKRTKPHLIHSNHSLKREEYIAINKIKQTCSNVDALCGGSGINVSVKTIFDNETIR